MIEWFSVINSLGRLKGLDAYHDGDTDHPWWKLWISQWFLF